jgi:hypothetical protein
VEGGSRLAQMHFSTPIYHSPHPTALPYTPPPHSSCTASHLVAKQYIGNIMVGLLGGEQLPQSDAKSIDLRGRGSVYMSVCVCVCV